MFFYISKKFSQNSRIFCRGCIIGQGSAYDIVSFTGHGSGGRLLAVPFRGTAAGADLAGAVIPVGAAEVARMPECDRGR